MRLPAVVLGCALLVLAAPAAAGPPLKATFSASTHTPKVNARWPYTVRVADSAGRPIAARLTVQIADPFGGVHPVQFGTTKKNIVNWPVKGTFRDFIVFPPDSKGFRLTVRAIVRTAKGKVMLTYWVKAR